MKLHTVENQPGMLVFQCPACGCCHFAKTDRWWWNGSMDRPTFTPSIRVTGTVPLTDDEIDAIMSGQRVAPRPLVCHFFVTEGMINYCADSTHAYRGLSVEIPDWE